MLIDTSDFEGLTNEDIVKLPEKWKLIIEQMDLEFFNIIKFTQKYLGNMRSYEGEWKDRVTNKITKRRFYDEREWRALKTKNNQTHLIFDWNDITEIIIKEKDEKQKLINVIKTQFEIDYEKANSKLKFVSNILSSDK